MNLLYSILFVLSKRYRASARAKQLEHYNTLVRIDIKLDELYTKLRNSLENPLLLPHTREQVEACISNVNQVWAQNKIQQVTAQRLLWDMDRLIGKIELMEAT